MRGEVRVCGRRRERVCVRKEGEREERGVLILGVCEGRKEGEEQASHTCTCIYMCVVKPPIINGVT